MAEANVNVRLDAIEHRVQHLENSVADLQVMTSKRCIVFSGADVRPIYGECPFDSLRRFVKVNWNMDLSRSDVAITHPLGDRKLIAEFVQRDFGSVFDRLMRHPRGNRRMKVFASLRLTSRQKRLQLLARKMVQFGDAKTSYICHVSGKLQIEDNDGRWKSISDPGQLFPLMSSKLRERLSKK